MLDPKIRQELAKSHQKATIIGIAMVATVLVYVLVAYLAAQGQNISGRSDPAVLSIIMAVLTFIAIGLGMGLIFIRRTLLSPHKAVEIVKKGSVGAIFFSATVIAFALAETPAVFGLVLFLLGGGWGYFLILVSLSIFYFLLAWPRLSKWEGTCLEALRMSK